MYAARCNLRYFAPKWVWMMIGKHVAHEFFLSRSSSTPFFDIPDSYFYWIYALFQKMYYKK